MSSRTLKGFTDVIVRTNLQPQHAVDLLRPGRQKYDWAGIAACPQLSADVDARDARQHDIEHNQVRRQREHPLEYLVAASNGIDFETLCAKIHDEPFADLRLVLDDEHTMDLVTR